MEKLILTKAEKGMITAEVLGLLVAENVDISEIYVFSYRHPGLLQSRLALTPDEEGIIAKAAILRESTSMPFWEAIMLSCFGEDRDYTRILQEAKFHQSHAGSMVPISRDEVLRGYFAQLIDEQPQGHGLSFSSQVKVDQGGLKQLPLLDFHCPECPENDRLVAEVCRHLFPDTTLVLSSGESYHGFGLALLEKHEFREFLTRSLLFAPVVDSRYVTHQLLEGKCALRLNHSIEKPTKPSFRFLVTP